VIRSVRGQSILAVILCVGLVNNMSAQDQDWDKIKKEAEAKKAAFDAQKAEADARKAALDAKKAADDAEAAARAAADGIKKAAAEALAAEAAKKALAEAKKQALDAEKALAEAEKTPDPEKQAQADRVAAAKAAKELADADKAAADAQKAKADASLAALKAQIGDVPDSGIKGEVTIKEKAGIMEAHLLAAKALNEAADRLVTGLPAGGGKTVLLYASAEVPNFQALLSYKVQVSVVSAAFANAETISDNATAKAPPATEAAPLAAAGLGLDAVTKLLGFFRSDYTIGGVEVSLDDSALVHGLAGRIAKSGKYKVQLPAVYNAGALSAPTKSIIDQLNVFALKRSDSTARITRHDQRAAKFTEEAGQATGSAREVLLAKAKLHKDASDALKAAITVYDSFFGKLTAADDKGLAPLTSVVRESVLADLLAQGNSMLVVKLQKAGGAYYTKKNLWTVFGGMPFYAGGGVVISYALLAGQSGNVEASGLIPVFGGFVKENKLETKLNGK